MQIIANMQIILNKIDSDRVNLEKFIYYKKVYLALHTGKNYSSSGNLQNIFNKN